MTKSTHTYIYPYIWMHTYGPKILCIQKLQAADDDTESNKPGNKINKAAHKVTETGTKTGKVKYEKDKKQQKQQ